LLKGFHNLISYLAAYNNREVFDAYKKINDISEMSTGELEGIKKLAEEIIKVQNTGPKLSGYYFNRLYNIRISEEFDIIRYSNDSFLNIELKSNQVDENTILDQLENHRYLLGCLNPNKKIFSFTYISNLNILYKYNEGQLVISDFRELVSLISEDYIEEDLLANLKIEDLIISPYSDIDKFNNAKYFLNSDQKKIVNYILNEKKDLESVMIKGGAGTGKSLVLFELAKKLVQVKDKTVLFIFCSKLEDYGSINNTMNFIFTDIRNYEKALSTTYDYIIVDEAQRLKIDQFEKLSNTSSLLIFSVDKEQTLKYEEDTNNIEDLLTTKLSTNNKFDLKTKVRTDISLSTFIRKFFNLSEKKLNPIEFPKVNSVYFSDKEAANEFINDMIESNNFVSIEVPEFKSKIDFVIHNKKINNNSLDGFKVIGREYDNVIIPLDNRAFYFNNKLFYKFDGQFFPYKTISGLFQATTRVKKNLLFVVIGNFNLYKTIEEIINWKKDRDNANVAKRLRVLRNISNLSEESLAEICECSLETYKSIEDSGYIQNSDLMGKLAKEYNVDVNFLKGDPVNLKLTEFDILYKLKRKGLNNKQKEELDNKLIQFLSNYENEM
jgi:hypothetical protein